MVVVRVGLAQEGIVRVVSRSPQNSNGRISQVGKCARVTTVMWYLSRWHLSTSFQYEFLSQISQWLDSMIYDKQEKNLNIHCNYRSICAKKCQLDDYNQLQAQYWSQQALGHVNNKNIQGDAKILRINEFCIIYIFLNIYLIIHLKRRIKYTIQVEAQALL